MTQEVLIVDGMSCDACVRHVTNALKNVPGVESTEVKLTEGKAFVNFDPSLANVAALVEAIEEEGYSARLAR